MLGGGFLSEKNNVWCAVCGKPYHLCMSCEDVRRLSPWKIFTDTPEHYKVFQIVKGYNVGIYTKDEANEKFKNVDLSDIDEFRDIVKEKIIEITAGNKQSVKKKKVNKKTVITVEENKCE